MRNWLIEYKVCTVDNYQWQCSNMVNAINEIDQNNLIRRTAVLHILISICERQVK